MKRLEYKKTTWGGGGGGGGEGGGRRVSISGPWTTEIIILFSVLLLSLNAHNHVDDYSGTLRDDRTKKERRKKGEKKKKRKKVHISALVIISQ